MINSVIDTLTENFGTFTVGIADLITIVVTYGLSVLLIIWGINFGINFFFQTAIQKYIKEEEKELKL